MAARPLQLEVRAVDGQRIHLVMGDIAFHVGDQGRQVYVARRIVLPQAEQKRQQDQHADGNHQDAAAAILALSSTSVPLREARVSTLTAVGVERGSRDGRITDEDGPR